MAEKEEKKDKGKKGSGLWSIMTLAVVPLFMLLFSDVFGFRQYDWIWWGMLALAAVPVLLAGIRYIRNMKYRALNEFFEGAGLAAGGKRPVVLCASTTKRREIYTVAMPAGLALSDFEKKKEALEQHLRRQVSFAFDGDLIIIAVRPEGSRYPYG